MLASRVAHFSRNAISTSPSAMLGKRFFALSSKNACVQAINANLYKSNTHSPRTTRNFSSNNNITVIPQAAEEVASSWSPTALLETALTTLHDTTGLPWWATIVVSCLAVRLTMFPLFISSFRNTSRLSLASPELASIRKKMSDLPPEQIRSDAAMLLRNQMTAVLRKYDCSPLKSFINPVVSIPIFLTFFMTMRRMAAETDAFHWGGAAWFTDLAAADPTYLLPLINSALLIGTIAISSANNPSMNQLGKNMKYVFIGLTVVMIPLTANMPSALFCYWIASSTFTLLQSIVLRIPAIKQMLKIPDPPKNTQQLMAANETFSDMMAKITGANKKVAGKQVMSQADFHKKQKKE